jgi:hypothetical protein
MVFQMMFHMSPIWSSTEMLFLPCIPEAEEGLAMTYQKQL